jgi:hypothetical protein
VVSRVDSWPHKPGPLLGDRSQVVFFSSFRVTCSTISPDSRLQIICSARNCSGRRAGGLPVHPFAAQACRATQDRSCAPLHCIELSAQAAGAAATRRFLSSANPQPWSRLFCRSFGQSMPEEEVTKLHLRTGSQARSPPPWCRRGAGARQVTALCVFVGPSFQPGEPGPGPVSVPPCPARPLPDDGWIDSERYGKCVFALVSKAAGKVCRVPRMALHC